MIHLNLPGVPDYRERITVYCEDRIVELVFPSPYLRNMPTQLTVRRGSGGHALETQEIRASFEEAFREELRAFYAAITEGKPVQTPFEQGRCDLQVVDQRLPEVVAMRIGVYSIRCQSFPAASFSPGAPNGKYST